MIIRIVGAIVIVGACYLYAQLLSMRLMKRLYVLQDLHKLGRIFKASVRYVGADIDEVFEDIRKKVSEEVSRFLEVVIEEIRNRKVTDISQVWNKAIEEQLRDYYLSSEEISVIKRLGDTIGSLDRQMQIESADLYLCELGDRINILSEEMRIKNRLYRSISIATGIFIVLLIC